MQIGFVGTGTMGTPIASRLIHAGHSLSVYDRHPEATVALCTQGAVRANSAFDAARHSEVVFTSLPGPTEFAEAMLEPQIGILAGLQPGAAHIDLTTNSPKTVVRIAETCRSYDVELIDAPVSGRPPTMTVMIGASNVAFAKYRTLFEVIAAEMGLGHAVENYEWDGLKMPGRVVDLTTAQASEEPMRNLYHRWAQFMEADSWNDLMTWRREASREAKAAE
jgi:3-hydroxyisobutyrate dehydrogenase-like beta-hydroxyacid dehydrogenase